MLTVTRMTKTEPAYVPPKWSTGTDAEIIEALEKHYNNEIDLTDYWSVGDKRVIHLDSMSATGVNDSHVAQNVTMVIMNIGGKTLYSPINGHTECAFIIGQQDLLANSDSGEYGRMNSSATNSGGWESSQRRTWCNEVYKNAISDTIVSIFKQFHNVTGTGGSSSGSYDSIDYFALPAEKELFGQNFYADESAESTLSQFEYYETSANRIKHIGSNNSAYMYWLRSPSTDSGSYNTSFCNGTQSGGIGIINANVNYGIAPFGCI